MGAVSTAAATLDIDLATLATDLATFIAAVQTSQASNVSLTKPDGASILAQWATAIMEKLTHYPAFQQLFLSADLPEAIMRYSHGGKVGNANPTTTLATVFTSW